MDEASAALAHVAEVVVEVLFADVLAGLEEHHGRPGGGCAVVAMGKLGAGEMTFESDEEEARFLAGAVRMQRAIQGLVRLTWNQETPVRDAPEPLRRKLAATLECTSLDELEARLRATQERAFDLYQERIGRPAERA